MSNLRRQLGKSNLLAHSLKKHAYPETMYSSPLLLEEKDPNLLKLSTAQFGDPQENAGVENVDTSLYRTGGKTRKARKARKGGKTKKARKAKRTKRHSKRHNKRHSKRKTFRKF